MQTILLTGASSGIGAALARHLAHPGRRLILVARDPDRLATVSEAARAKGAEVIPHTIDLRNTDEMRRMITAKERRHPIDLVIANAGVSGGLDPDGTPEAPRLSRRMIDINLVGTLNTIEPLLAPMLARGAGHIALMSSLAALSPHPDLPVYSATKAAVRAYGTALRGWLAPRGIAVTVISPGFVTSPMSARHHGPRPFEIPADRAAAIIARGLARRTPLVTFPWQLALLSWGAARLPPRLSDLAMRAFAARIAPDDGR